MPGGHTGNESSKYIENCRPGTQKSKLEIHVCIVTHIELLDEATVGGEII